MHTRSCNTALSALASPQGKEKLGNVLRAYAFKNPEVPASLVLSGAGWADPFDALIDADVD